MSYRRAYNFRRESERNPYTPNAEAQTAAEAYCAKAGFPPPQTTPYVKVNELVAREIAAAFEAAIDDPQDPEVLAAYTQLVKEVKAQYKTLPIEIIPYSEGEPEPYNSSEEMMDDVLNNHALLVFDGGDDHSFLTREENFMFRAVHDYYGHAKKGFAFGPRGEENAWVEHSKMFSPLARAAMTSETRGQNSMVNFGKFSHLPIKKRPYADQKAVLLPIKFQTRLELDLAYADYPDFYPQIFIETRLIAANKKKTKR